MPPRTAADVAAFSPLQLAYIGDSVYDLLVRTDILKADAKMHRLHQSATQRVNAAAQARALKAITEYLTEEEADLVRRSRNAHAKHQAPRSSSCAEYNAATALEALLGYLYLSGQMERLHTLFLTIRDAKQEDVHA